MPPNTNTLGCPSGGTADHTLLRLAVNVLAASPKVIPVTFQDQDISVAGAPPTRKAFNALVDETGKSVTVQFEAGQITVSPAALPVPPLARAGPDQLVPEASGVILDASASESPLSAPLTFLWQVDPLAQDAVGTDAVQLQFTAPPVTGDAQLSFEVAVNDGTGSSTDQVSVFVLDMDARTAVFANAPSGSVGRIGSSDQAIVFAGRMQWASPYEGAYWTRVKFTATGTGDESALLGGITLHADSNGDGHFNSGDRQLGEEASLTIDGGSVEFTFLDTLEDAVPRTYFLVAHVPHYAATGSVGVVSVLLLGAVFLARKKLFRARAPALRGGLSLALLAALGLSLSFTLGACGGGGGGGGSDRQVRFSILAPQDVGVQGLSSGVNITVDSLPFDGPTLKV
jgi:hypothetical protein